MATLADDRAAFASVLTDVKRVELRMPDGQQLEMTPTKLGEFQRTWTPTEPVEAGSITLHVVAVDRAVNERVFDVAVEIAK
jgi:hypothetical protein